MCRQPQTLRSVRARLIGGGRARALYIAHPGVHGNIFRGRCIMTDIVERQSFDADYVQRLINSDRPTEEAFAAYFGELLTIKLRSRLRTPELIQDVTQETFL